MFFAVVMLTCLVSAVLWAVLVRTPLPAWLSVIFGAMWLPANNGHLEGHNLLTLSATHGVTQGDAIGVIGWLLGIVVLLGSARRGAARTGDSGRVRAVLILGLALLGLGALSAFAMG